jgi:hypothetical protein
MHRAFDIGVVDNRYQIFSFRKYHPLPDIGIVARPRAQKIGVAICRRESRGRIK